jgi:hypothetical protein
VATGRDIDAGEKRDTVTLEDRRGSRRVFPMLAEGFRLDGAAVTLVRPAADAALPRPERRRRTASGSFAVPGAPTRVARSSRIWVEGVHDASVLERIWGDDLRLAGVVVEPIDGIDRLADRVRAFRPGPDRRLGVLVDHLVPGSKESRLVATITDAHLLVTGHPYVDVWQAVKPTALGIDRWPEIPKDVPWKDGVCAALGVTDPSAMWRRVLGAVRGYGDVEPDLLGAVERLLDFVIPT